MSQHWYDSLRRKLVSSHIMPQSFSTSSTSRSRHNPPHDFQHPSSSSHMEYEEIESSIECPTCQGTGRISKETEAEYVALIPLTDKRLRPRRTILYVGLTFFICSIIIILLVVLLIPRSLYLKSNAPYITPIHTVIYDNNTTMTVHMYLENKVNLTNGNLVGIQVTELSMSATLYHYYAKTAISRKKISLQGLQTKELAIRSNISLSSKTLKIMQFCRFDEIILRTINLHFVFSVKASFLGQQLQTSTSVTQGVDCYSPNITYTK